MPTVDILLFIVLSMIMFGVGTSLSGEGFRDVFREKKPVFLGLFFQIVFLPLTAFLIAIFSGLPATYQMGIFLVALCPGGSTSNFISYLVDADVALSISLTTVNSFIVIFSIPLLAQWGHSFFFEGVMSGDVEIWRQSILVLAVVLLPVLLGMGFHRRFPQLAQKIQKPFKYISSFLIAIVFAVKVFGSESAGGTGITLDDLRRILPFCLALHFVTMILSYFFSRLAGLERVRSTTIGIEVGLQNSSLALLVAASLYPDRPEISQPALVIGAFTFFTSLAFGYLLLRNQETRNG